jgi:hypothetical protein
VFFGTVAAASVTAVSPTEITAVSPSEATGLRNVFVTTPGGKSAATTADWFTYVVGLPLPVVTSVSPRVGPEAGGTVVTVTGKYLTGATVVLFGTTDCTSVTVVSDTELEVTSPPEAPGLRNIFVTTPDGTRASDTGHQFDYS